VTRGQISKQHRVLKIWSHSFKDLEPNLSERQSEANERQPIPKGHILWELESPTTVEQVQNSKKCQKKDTSPGLDGITSKNHMGFQHWNWQKYLMSVFYQVLFSAVVKRKAAFGPRFYP